MIAAARKARIILGVYYAYMTEYRTELLLWMLAGILPFVLMGVWMEAGRAGDFPLGPTDFARYFLAVFLVRQMTVVWAVYELDELVVKGKLSPWLLQPLDPFWRILGEHVAERFARAPFVLVLVALFFLLYPDALWWPGTNTLLAGTAAVLAAFVARFLLEYTLGLLSFWVERAGNMQQLWFLANLFLSGTIAPLEVYPPAMRTFAELTPFPSMVYFPAQLLVGGEVNVAWGFAVLGFWTLVFMALKWSLWRRGLRQYSAMGA